MKYVRTMAFAGLLLALGCGDDDGSSGSAGGSQSTQALCQRICARAANQHCGDTTQAECDDACMEQAVSTPAQCNKPLDAFLRCAEKAKYQCNASTGNADAIGCLDQLDDLQSCFFQYAGDVDTEADASTPAPRADSGTPTTSRDSGTPTNHGDLCESSADSDACDRCSNSNCCAEISACATDATCASLSDCLNECGEDDSSCQQACLSGASPSTYSAFSAMVTCFATECGAQCASDASNDAGVPSADAGSNNGEPNGCLPTGVPPGYCNDPKRPVGHECHNVTPPGDCVALENVSDVFCCAS